MTKKSNGSTPPDDKKIVQFRTLADKDRARKKEQKKQLKQEKKWQSQYKAGNANTGPMFNLSKISPFARYFTALLVLSNIPLLLSPKLKLEAIYTLGFIPSQITNGDAPIFHLHTFLSYTLLHEGWTHLLFNAIMLLALGTFFERIYKTKTTIIFFALTALAGSLAYLALDFGSNTPMVGASAGISGLFAAAIMSMTTNRQTLAPANGKKPFGPWQVIILWLCIMVGISFLFGGPIAYHAHIGGFLAGAFLFHALQKGIVKF